ncbi:shikimate dehydrogenase [Amaricoccus sp.]|uniref:shikimate dehydrogenase n=1 Tax=Amaricoccus sp. TaxID=1872485 RepID=UPI001B499AF9|nr:shikimate dehydrogenase [Amaricoccus sp.]MBP7002410.1 shikimate dehydrogenase [Amaricoccus sp.]
MTEPAPAVPLLAGVLGWPIRHSRSPQLHGHWLARYGIRGHYVPLAVRPEDVPAALAALPKLGFRGVNVTIPHKEAALALAARATPTAELIGAANTLTFDANGGFEADNTDAYGFVRNLRQAAPGWSAAAGPALILGAGGASRAVIAALLEDGAPEIRLANRTRARAEGLRDHFGPRIVVVDWEGAAEAAAGAATIVNTSALGMGEDEGLPVRLDAAPAGALVTDIVYTPLVTPFLVEARARGLRIVDGLGMLLHQGAPGFERWFGRAPEVDDDLRRAVLAS